MVDIVLLVGEPYVMVTFINQGARKFAVATEAEQLDQALSTGSLGSEWAIESVTSPSAMR